MTNTSKKLENIALQHYIDLGIRDEVKLTVALGFLLFTATVVVAFLLIPEVGEVRFALPEGALSNLAALTGSVAGLSTALLTLIVGVIDSDKNPLFRASGREFFETMLVSAVSGFSISLVSVICQLGSWPEWIPVYLLPLFLATTLRSMILFGIALHLIAAKNEEPTFTGRNQYITLTKIEKQEPVSASADK